MHLDVNGVASSGWAFRYNAFCILSTCSSVQRRLRELFGSSRWQGLRFHLGIVRRQGCTRTVQKIARLFAHVSCQCAWWRIAAIRQCTSRQPIHVIVGGQHRAVVATAEQLLENEKLFTFLNDICVGWKPGSCGRSCAS